MRATDLLGVSVVGPAGRALGEVLDVRLVQDGPLLGTDCALRIEGLIVGRRKLSSHLGYDRAGVRGPALVAAIARRLSAGNRYLRWEDVADLQRGTVQSRTDQLPSVPKLPDRT